MAALAVATDGLVATPVLAEQTKVPANYLAKVLQQLAAAKLITGRRGVGGGYRLARAAVDIRLLEVINAVTTVKRIDVCPLGIAGHGSRLCALHRKSDEAAKAVMEVFGSTTLQDLLTNDNPSKPLCDPNCGTPLTVSASAR